MTLMEILKSRLEQTIALPSNLSHADKIVDVLDDQIVSSRQGGFQKFYVRWKNCPLSDASWITATDFQCQNSDIYEHYLEINSSELSSFKPGRVDAVHSRSKNRTRKP